MSAARERPILFSAPMVRALLAGLKTVTRRLVTVPYNKGSRCLPYEPYYAEENGRLMMATEGPEWLDYEENTRSPFGEAGDRLWVKETHRIETRSSSSITHPVEHVAHYRATSPDANAGTWKPSIFMPRWASRITLEVTDVRVERLQEITDVDAHAEGAPFSTNIFEKTTSEAFAELWDEINGKRAPWSANPWVWRVAFRRLP